MTNVESLKIAVVSDLHCMHKTNTSASGITFLYTNAPKNPIVRHPVYALLDLLEKNKDIRADILICPGDIADKADEQGIITGWEFLKKIQLGIEAKQLLATTGNHDVDSRRSHPYTNAFHLLKSFADDYPLINNDSYWNKNFAFIETDDCLILILNTCHNHNSKEDSGQSIVNPDTLESIKQHLEKIGKKKYLFAFCHHHPVKHSNIDIAYKDGDVIDNGDKLIQLLNEYDFQIIVHGHKHDPRLKKENSLTVFAAGSFSSLMNIKELGADNCFHLIELFPFKKQGTISSWIYAPTKGWEVRNDREFPCFTGFGNELSVEALAKHCSEIFINDGKEMLTYKSIVSQLPDLQYLIPEDQKKLTKVLKKDYSLSLVPELPNIPKILTSLLND